MRASSRAAALFWERAVACCRALRISSAEATDSSESPARASAVPWHRPASIWRTPIMWLRAP